MGFQYIELMSGDSLDASPAATADLLEWADQAQMQTIPILDAHEFEMWGPFEINFATPSITHIGPDMSILSIDGNIRDPAVFLDESP